MVLPVEHQWNIGGKIWRYYQWSISLITVEYQWYNSGYITYGTMEIIGITTVLITIEIDCFTSGL